MPRLNDLTSVVLGSSRSSFIHTICKFVRDVDEMNDTVLVPSMLTDLNKCSTAVSSSSSSSPDLSDCFDLQTLHQLLNRLKDELTIARFDDDNSSSSSTSPINCNSSNATTTSSSSSSNPTTTTTTLTMILPSSSSNINNTNQITSSSSSCSLRIAEGDLTGLSKKLHSCKCSGSSSDDGFSSLNSYSRNSDDESTSSHSPASDSDSECCSSSSTPNQSRENDSTSSSAESSPEYIVNLLRLHIQGIQSILTRFSKYADHVSDSYVNSLN